MRRAPAACLPVLLILAALAAPAAADPDPGAAAEEGGYVLDFTLARIDGRDESLEAYRGQVLLLVNVASRCGLTPQYEGLEALYERYRDRGFAVLGFPSNDFAGQEPGSDAEIAEFCRATYDVRFPMFSKIRVRGEGKHPLYARLTELPAPLGGEIEWNFQKFLVDRNGRVVARYDPRVVPEDAALVRRIEALLEEEPS